MFTLVVCNRTMIKQVNHGRSIFMIPKKSWHQQCEGKMTTIIAITLLESLTKHHAFTVITNSSDKLPWLPLTSSTLDNFEHTIIRNLDHTKFVAFSNTQETWREQMSIIDKSPQQKYIMMIVVITYEIWCLTYPFQQRM